MIKDRIMFLSGLSFLGAIVAIILYAMGHVTESTGLRVGGGLLLVSLAALCTGMLTRVRRDFFSLSEDIRREETVYVEALRQHTIFCVTRPDKTLVDVNEKFLEVFGYSRDEIIGRQNACLYPEGPGSAALKEVDAHVTSGKPWSGELRQITKSGEEVLMQCTVVPLIDGEGRHIKNVSVRTDVTEMRRASDQRRLTSILEGLPDQVYVFRVSDLRMIYLNDSARDWCFMRLNWADDDYMSKGLSDLDAKLDIGDFRERALPLLTDKATSVVYEGLHHGDPVEINLQLSKGAFSEDCYVAVVRDISVRREIEIAKREIVSVVSHELRTPLTSIRGSLSLLSSGLLGNLDEKAQSILKIAERNCERMLLVANDMLDLEKIESGKMDFTLSNLDLGQLVRDSIEENGGFAAQFGVRIESDLPEARVLIRGNADRLAQVMANLLSNAIKFSPKNGLVKVAVSDEGIGWRISVSDSGPGIAEEDKARIFDRFSQARPVDGVDRKGSGLGLHIVQNIVERHGGDIALESQIGVGTRFYFDLPKYEGNTKDMCHAAE